MTGEFSVIIPAFNAEDSLRRAIDSALDQSRPAHEVIVVDDGSTDDTWKVILSYGDRIIAHQQDNGGLGAARNSALALASGDFVVLLDADDEWMRERLERTAAALDEAPWADIVTTDAFIRYESGVDERYYATREVPPPDRQDVEILRENFIFVSSAVRRSALDAISGFDTGLAFDSEYATWVRLVLSGSRVVCANGVSVVYHRSAGSLSSDRARTYRMRLQVLDRAEQFGLSEVQRSVLQESRRELEALLLTHRALIALHERSPMARDLLRQAARHGVMRPSKRPLAWLASVAPRLAATGLERLPDRLRPRGP